MQVFQRRMMLPCVLVILLGCRPSTSIVDPTSASDAAAATGMVTLEIDRGGDVETIEIPDVPEGTTLETLMRGVDQIPVTIRGSGVTAFVDQLGDTATGGSEGWTFTVDGELASQGIGGIVLSPPTTIRWSFTDASGVFAE